MGVNKLGKVAKVMTEKGNLQGKHTHHSGRKTMFTQQLKNKVASIHVAQLSGHRNLMSLNSYHTMSLEEQMELSDNAYAINKGASVSKTNDSSNTSSELFGQDMSDD
ncbi:hypothetical protein DPMN_189963 [Dreissena polymorpha]|uniref:Tyr recombinase domain-containing protein n=1 Tax=Dreissena polymorpha TaxID=45954 RepID=A0A9D4DWG8_DREPO|nr:hypothetical protein DPMN_189963 [Dreissena polymorpha]